MTTTETESTTEYDHDVVVVGGGPAGCSAGVFTARYGLDTVIYDRGRSSIRQCAHLENYLGFPAGVDIETFYELIHDHAETAGCEVRPDLVESVERPENGDGHASGDSDGHGDAIGDGNASGDDAGFVVTPQEGDPVTVERVVAATRYDGEYCWPLGGEEMVTTHEHDGETQENFDREYPDHDGSTPIEGLYVATPSDADVQAIVAAGRGAQAARTLVRDVRRDAGIPDDFADHYDWLRRWDELDEEWRDRDRWREWFETEGPDAQDVDAEDVEAIVEAEIDRRFETYVDDAEIERRRERSQERLLDHVDDARILERAREIDADALDRKAGSVEAGE